MNQCDFCGASLPTNASFCGKCGHIPQQVAPQATQMSSQAVLSSDKDLVTQMSSQPGLYIDKDTVDNLPTTYLGQEGEETDISRSDTTMLIPSRKSSPLEGMSTMPLRAVTLVPLEDDDVQIEEDDDKQRRGLLLAGLAGALADERIPGQVPTASGTPQVAHIASLQGTPQVQQPPHVPGQALGNPSTPMLPDNWSIPNPQPLPAPIVHLPITPPPAPSQPKSGGKGSGSGSKGCLLPVVIAGITLVLILTSIITLGLTAWSPNLSLNGTSSVVSGGNMSLHGQSFLPNSSVALILDNSIPIYHAQEQAPGSQEGKNSAQILSAVFANSSNLVQVQGNGSFQVTFQVSPLWNSGKHIIHANETVTHRSASLDFTIALASATATPASTPTVGATPTVGTTPTVGPTPTNTPAGAPRLTCANPGTLALGPVSEETAQVSESNITLCGSGTGPLNWHASWTATWLRLSQNNGTIQAPGNVQVLAQGVATGLLAGTYRTVVTFTDLSNNTAITATVTLTVQVGCLTVTPQRLAFTGVAGQSNPGAKTINLKNCGLTSSWSAGLTSASTWLSLSSTSGTLNAGASTNITVNISNLKAGLAAGNYSDGITFKLGSRTATVTVALAVLARPTFSMTPTSLDSSSTPPCTSVTDPATGGVSSVCTLTLTNNGSASLSWSAASNTGNVSVSPSSGTVAAGGSVQITITVPINDCGNNVSVTFSGPANTISVPWLCTIIF